MLNESHHRELEKIAVNAALSQEGKNARTAEQQAKDARTAERLNGEALAIIDEARAAIEKRWHDASAGRLTDEGYQSGISNAIRMAELGVIDKVSLPDIVEAYKDDLTTLNAIGAIIEKSYPEHVKKDLLPLIPADTRQATLDNFEQMRKDINKIIGAKALESNNLITRIALTNRYIIQVLNDDLSL